MLDSPTQALLDSGYPTVNFIQPMIAIVVVDVYIYIKHQSAKKHSLLH